MFYPSNLLPKKHILLSILGAACHYLLLLLSFWLLCYVVNTFLLLVLHKHHIFNNPVKIHVVQLILCAIVPLIFVGICLLVKKPGYHMMFKDRLAILPSSYILIFGTVTLPVVLSAGASLTMLVTVVRNIRKVSRRTSSLPEIIHNCLQTSFQQVVFARIVTSCQQVGNKLSTFNNL